MTATARRLCLAALLALGVTAQAADHSLPGRVLRVVDGDSLVLDVRGSLYRVDIAGIDAPELNQPWGTAAAGELGRRLGGAFVVVDAVSVDATQVTGSIRFKQRDIGLELIRSGLVWSLFRSDSDALRPAERPHPYELAEQAAREARRGLWADEDPVAPWAWRRQRP